MELFLTNCIKRFEYYKELGDKTFEQLNDADMLFTPNEESNSIAIIVQHLYGNMLSRFTNFLTEDGEKEWRKRDNEFMHQQLTKQDVLSFWNEGWNCVFNTLKSLTVNDVEKTITIRGESLLVYDALLRQLAHYPYHVGQIVYIAKIIKNSNWQTLSIARNQSSAFNTAMQQQHSK